MTSAPQLIPAPLAGPVPAPLRVLYLIDSLGPGGAEQLLVAYLRHLADHRVEPVVATFHLREGNPLAIPIRKMGIQVLDLDIHRLRQQGAYRRVARLIDEVAPHLVHTQLEFANVFGTVAAHRRGIPTVSTLHTLDRPEPGSRDHRRFRLMTWILRRFADRVIAVSESARMHYLAVADLSPGQVITLHNGIDLDEFVALPGAASSLRAELGIPADAALLTTVAVLREPKGVQHMLGAFPEVVRSVPYAHYLVVGDGDHRRQLEHTADDLGIGSRVTFAGHRSDLGRILAATDVFVLPTLTEALPTVVAEAMAASVPIVATTVGGIPEMVIPEHTAILVAPGDEPALAAGAARLLSNPLQASIMGRAGRRLAEARFDLRRQAAELVEEYCFLVAGGARS